MCHPRFTALLLRVPCTCDLQTTASVMPERSNTPNLALKRSAKSQFSKLLHIFQRKINICCLRFFDRQDEPLVFQNDFIISSGVTHIVEDESC